MGTGAGTSTGARANSTGPQPARGCKVCANRSDQIFSLQNEHGTPTVLDLFLCRHCGLLFVGNDITEAELAHAYGTLDGARYYREIATGTAAKVGRSLQDLHSLLASLPANSSVLEVGCGHGHFLEALVRSYPSVDAFGHELPGEAACACWSKGLRAFTCALEDVPVEASIVVLLDVAEHVPQPLRTFAACHSRLKENGCIYIHTPRRCFWDNVFLLAARVPGLRRLSVTWLRTRVSIFHLQLWTDEALQLSLQRVGFGTISIRREMELSWPVKRYASLYVGEKLGLPLLAGIIGLLSDLLFVRLGTLKNKAVCLAFRK